ncbi:MAG TPA: DUF1697 domain-containing protein [Devosia sp.]|jgi:uncharacterized protein (DUF1697 family)|uniref:DUF1697 domain-containing protein n=1 Tax=Devosia sp. TaxID=1871048 RepID=UPI002F93E475
MSQVWCAFLCGVNVGKRQMKMAELQAAMEAAGFGEIKTVLASGNVRFSAEEAPDAVKARLEELIAERFGFPVTVILRSLDEVEAMLAAHPFGSLNPGAELTRHVILFEHALPNDVALDGRPGDTEILRIDPRELYLAGYRQSNGRYTEHVEEVLAPLYKRLSKDNTGTMRNWNTMEKMLR